MGLSFNFMLAAAPVIQYDAKYKEAQAVKVGGTLNLPITVTGIPAPKITWYFGDNELKTGNGTTVEVSDTASRLTLKNVMATQIGVYRVKAENSAGSDKAQFTTILKGITRFLFWVILFGKVILILISS